jgi:hypothetical protein
MSMAVAKKRRASGSTLSDDGSVLRVGFALGNEY